MEPPLRGRYAPLDGLRARQPAAKRGQGTAGKANPQHPLRELRRPPLRTQTVTTHADPCPSCDQDDRVYWVDSTLGSDTWACRHCGTEWTIPVHVPGR